MITVYYGSYSTEKRHPEYCYDPLPILNTVYDDLGIVKGNFIRRCPAITDSFKNTYKILSSYDYNISWDGSTFASTMYDQEFFNNTVIIRDTNNGIFSYTNPGMYFYADCESLEIETITPLYEKHIIYDGVTIPGKYDCANHFRKLECAIKLKRIQNIEIKDGSTLYYVRFLTDEKIKFVRFNITEEMILLLSPLTSHRNHTTKVTPLTWYYNIMKKYYNKKIIKLIKNNVLE